MKARIEIDRHAGFTAGRGRIVLAVLLFPALLALGAAAGVAPAKAKTTEPDMAHTIIALKQYSTDTFDIEVPAGARPLLTTLKRQARDLVAATLNAHPAPSKNLKEIRKALAAELTRQRLAVEKAVAAGQVGPPPEPESSEIGMFTYGDVPQIAVKPVSGHPELIAAVTTVEINCGSDSSFYLFKKHTWRWRDLLSFKAGTKWDLILAQETNDYKDVGGGQGELRYAFSSPSFAGEPFVVVTNTVPWCTSAWNNIHYRALRPGKSAYRPTVLLDCRRTLYLGAEQGPVVTMLPKGFRIEFATSRQFDMNGRYRNNIAQYLVSGERVLRVPPFASRPEDFFDEWLNMPWQEASKWTEPAALGALSTWHEVLGGQGPSGQAVRFTTEFIFDKGACRVGPDQWQVGIAFEKTSKEIALPPGIPKEAYFKVARKGKDFFVTGVSDRDEGSCPGEARRRSEGSW